MKDHPVDPSQPPHRGALALHGRHPLTVQAAAGLGAVDRLDQSFNLRDLLRIFLKRKWTILIIFLVFAAFSVVRTYMAQPVYRASTTLQIERFTPRVLEYKDVTPGETDYSDSVDFYNTNYELLKSRTLSERAVEDLGMRKAPSSDAPKEAPAKTVSTSFLDDLVTRIRRGPPPADVDTITREDNALVGAFQGSVTVEPVRRSRLVRLHFDSTDPFFAAKAVNTLAQSFVNINLERRFEASAYAKTFLEEKLAQTKARLEDSERDLVKFSRDTETPNLDDKQNISSLSVQEFSAAVSKAEQERIKAEALYQQAQENPDSIPTVRDNRNIIEIKERKGKLESEYQELLKIYKPAFPKMQQVKNQIEEVDRQLQVEYDRIRGAALSSLRSARTQESLLKQRLESGKQLLLDLQGRSIRYSILKREVDTNRQLYDGLLQRLKEIGVAGGVGINNISVVDKAQVPIYPYKPDFGKSVSMGLAIGLIIGLLVAWLLEHLDDSIRFADDVERETGAAVLGVVPKMKVLDPGKTRIALSPHLDPSSAFSEAYRSVRTALQFSTASGAPRRMVVTSSSKNEGKSTTALALAINFAQMGKPVLLIDADLRNPVLHKLLQLDNDRGLSNYLSGNVGVMEVVHRTEIPGLFVMTTGPLPPNPVELISGTKMLSLLAQCEEHFAHVIVDGPPVLGIADAIVLCNQVDNAVFVIESGRTRKGHAKAALKRLHQAGVHPLGVILTKIDAYHDLYGYGTSYYQYAKPAIAAKPTAEV
ncbi:MAG: polysaccharide biosynthesis tyrosine autokinase [Burkholderiales bacterium]|nr:polysaccharide biosynthesis tyrosine autokinase [Burkholderiales bacterium]